ncbi:MAG: sigma-70 family RNA polymerase sigma factor [Clostridia bacterium]
MQENYRTFTVELHSYTNEELVEFFQTTQKEEYLKELMTKNRGIIYNVATTYSIPAHDLEDLMEIGYIALWEATKHYDKNRGFAFTTALKGFLKQRYNRLYNEAYRMKRGNGEKSLSYEELDSINKESYSTDDYSNIYIGSFFSTLADTTRKVAELLFEGLSKSDIARLLECTPATISYHVKRIQTAYALYEGGQVSI